MDSRGQGALEYLLLIGGAVVVAVIVIVLLIGFAHSGAHTSQEVFGHAMHTLESSV